MIEEELRAAFLARTRTLPAMADAAGVAISRARTIRRRRHVAGAAVAVLFVLSVSGGVLRYFGTIGQVSVDTELASESPARVAAANTMDVRVGQELWTADGRHFALSEVGTVTWVRRVPAGWLYAGDTGGVRLLSPDGSSVDPQIEGTDVAVSPDGTRVAWSMAAAASVPSRIIFAARLSAKGVVAERVSANAPQGVQPIGFAGARVLLRQAVQANPGAEPRQYRYDFWTIGHSYTPTWVDKVSTLYGEYRSSVLGQVPGADGEDCLALFEPAPDGLRLETKRCGLNVNPSDEGALSPTGRWLALRTPTRLRLLDLDRVFGELTTLSNGPSPTPTPVVTKAPNPVTCQAEASAGPPIWIGPKLVIATTPKGWAVCTASGKAAAVDDPALAQLTWAPVPGTG